MSRVCGNDKRDTGLTLSLCRSLELWSPAASLSMEHQCQLSGIGGVSAGAHIPTHSSCLPCAALDPLHTEQIIKVIVVGLGPIQVPMSMVMMTH